jgi:hypothetical protein
MDYNTLSHHIRCCYCLLSIPLPSHFKSNQVQVYLSRAPNTTGGRPYSEMLTYLHVLYIPTSFTSYLCTPTRYCYSVYIAKLFNVYFIPCVILFLIFFSLHCWEVPVSENFTVSLHLLFTTHVTNTIRFHIYRKQVGEE